MGVHQPTPPGGLFPGKWEICHQKAPKLSKTLTSLELFTGKTAHRFTIVLPCYGVPHAHGYGEIWGCPCHSSQQGIFHGFLAFSGAVKQLGLPTAAHFAFSKSSVTCLGLFKLTFFLFIFILLFFIKVLLGPRRDSETWRVSTGLAYIRGGQFPNHRLSFCIPSLLALLRKTRGTHAASCKDSFSSRMKSR